MSKLYYNHYAGDAGDKCWKCGSDPYCEVNKNGITLHCIGNVDGCDNTSITTNRIFLAVLDWNLKQRGIN